MLLTPYRVLDLTGPLGFLTGKIFGDLGADVIKIEPPFLNNGNGCHQSLSWLAYNTNKRGVTLNLENDKGRDLFYRLALESDFIIETVPTGAQAETGLAYEELSRPNPGLILVSISP